MDYGIGGKMEYGTSGEMTWERVLRHLRQDEMRYGILRVRDHWSEVVGFMGTSGS